MPSFPAFIALPCRPLIRALRPVEPATLFQLYVFPSNAITTCDAFLIRLRLRVKIDERRKLSGSPALCMLYQANAASTLPVNGAAPLLALTVPSCVTEFSAYHVAT